MLKRFADILIVLGFFLFSVWLMQKSFGYEQGEFRISRHQVGDFGLHISLIRSFSRGDNIPVESPFFPGKPLPYHWGVDFISGLLERAGLRIDYALNGVSIVAFTLLLYLIYRLTQILFGESAILGLLAVVFFIFSSNLTYVKFLSGQTLSSKLLKQVWTLPDYIYKGPFDGSIISIFSSLNPYLNQRHLIVGLAINLLVLSFLFKKLLKNNSFHVGSVILVGVVVGISTRIHSLVAVSAGIIVVFSFMMFGRAKLIGPFISAAILSALPHAISAFAVYKRPLLEYFNPGYLASRPLTIFSWLAYWWENIGLVSVFLPIGFLLAQGNQRKIFWIALPLFVVANVFQLSYRMEHNHSVLAVFFIFANMFVAHAVYALWGSREKLIALVIVFLLTASGFLNLMVIKNDFAYRVADSPKNRLIEWVSHVTPENAIILGKQDLYDPITLAGRKNYLGATYYLNVMGYDTGERHRLVRQFFEARSKNIFDVMRAHKIDYVILPNGLTDNFPYDVDRTFFDKELQRAYQDQSVTVYML